MSAIIVDVVMVWLLVTTGLLVSFGAGKGLGSRLGWAKAWREFKSEDAETVYFLRQDKADLEKKVELLVARSAQGGGNEATKPGRRNTRLTASPAPAPSLRDALAQKAAGQDFNDILRRAA